MKRRNHRNVLSDLRLCDCGKRNRLEYNVYIHEMSVDVYAGAKGKMSRLMRVSLRQWLILRNELKNTEQKIQFRNVGSNRQIDFFLQFLHPANRTNS